jgi:nitrogen fixation protein FixH
MKINWGTGLVLGMACFIGFISFLVYKMTTDNNLDHDLVTDQYYQKEMELQENIYAQQNTAAMTIPITGVKTESGYLLTFPAKYSPYKITGTVLLYRPSNKLLDFKIPINMEESTVLVPANQLLEGRWNITINWEYEGESYRFIEKITY